MIKSKAHNKPIRYLFFFGLILFSFINVYSQKLTTLNFLDSAKASYKTGQLNIAKDFLDTAVQIRSSKQIKSDIFLYKARIFAQKKNAILSKYYTQKMLVLSPFIHLESDEFPEIRQTAEQSLISPRLSFELITGLNFAMIKTHFGINSITKENTLFIRSNKASNPTTIYGLIANFYVRPKIFFSTGIERFALNFIRKNYIQGISSSMMNLSMNYLQNLLLINYDFSSNHFYNHINKFNMNIGVGIYYSVLLSSYASSIQEQNASGKIDTYNYFEHFTPGLTTQLSFSYRIIPQAILSFKTELNHDLQQITASNIFFYGQGDELIFDYYQNMDAISLNYLKFELSFSYFLKYKIFNNIVKKQAKQTLNKLK